MDAAETVLLACSDQRKKILSDQTVQMCVLRKQMDETGLAFSPHNAYSFLRFFFLLFLYGSFLIFLCIFSFFRCTLGTEEGKIKIEDLV